MEHMGYALKVRILVTGGSGFVGSHLAEKLLEDGHSVVVLDNLSTSHFKNLENISDNPNFKFIDGSVLDTTKLEELISNTDYIFHLAAAVGVFNIVKKPLDSLLVNIRGTENILELANKYKIPVLITSSSEVYGKNTKDSLSETDDRIIGSPTILRWSYSEAKAIDESLAMAYFVEHKLHVRIVRFFNTVGPRQVGNYGMVVPRFIKMALNNEPITIYGDGKQTRCFGHIYDVIEGLILVAFNNKTIGQVINIGNNKEISIHELAKLIIEKTNSKSEIKFVDYKDAYGDGFEDMERRVPNINLIKELTGWQPKRDLNKIIEDVVEFQRNSL
jgi:UDP-glucose 4-epimerase